MASYAGSTILILLVAAALAAAESPVQKAIELLSGLEIKISADAAKEKTDYEAYATWCKDGAKDKEFEVITAKRDIGELTATGEKAASDIATQSSRIQDLAGSISADKADLKAATQIRESEHADFVSTEQELVQSIDTLERATNILERKLRGSALLQSRVDRKDVSEMLRSVSLVIDAASFSVSDKTKLLELVQNSQTSDDGDLGAPAPEAYSSHSASIIDVLEDLKQKAVTALADARRQETNAKHHYDLLKQSLEDQGKADNKEFDGAKQILAEAQEAKATSQGDLAVTSKALLDAESTLKNMNADCKSRAEDHESAVQNFGDELKAISAARGALVEMTGAAASATYGSASSLLQIGDHRLRSSADLAHFEVANLVRKLAKNQHSPELAQLAAHISATIEQSARSGADPFGKVRSMITQMIDSLEKDASSEASHKAYCDEQFGETREKIAELKHDIDKSSAKIDTHAAESATLKEDVSMLQQELAEAAKQQSAADQQRAAERETYVQVKSDLEQGLRGVRLASKILREYYAGTSLVQQPADPAAHEASTGAGTSVIGLLEVVEADFSKSLANTEMDEESAATAYHKFSMQNRLSTQMKQKDVEYKSREAARLDKDLSELSSDRDASQTELDAVLEYSKHIRGMCELVPETYSQRTARRDAEIAGLREALAVLNGQTAFLQRRASSFLRGAVVVPHA